MVYSVMYAFAALCLSSLATGAEPQFQYERRSERVLHRVVHLPPDQFTVSVLRKVAERFVRNDANGLALGMLTVVTDQAKTTNSLLKFRAEVSFETSIEALKGIDPDAEQVARVLLLEGVAVLSIRDRSELIVTPIAGKDERVQFKSSGHPVELLHFSLSGPPDGPILHMYAQGIPDLSVSSAIAVVRHVAAITGLKDVGLDLRTDPWFMMDQGFPDRYPFAELPPFPSTVSQYRSAPSIRCFMSPQRGLRCRGNDFVP